jgi:hypothetical protein
LARDIKSIVSWTVLAVFIGGLALWSANHPKVDNQPQPPKSETEDGHARYDLREPLIISAASIQIVGNPEQEKGEQKRGNESRWYDTFANRPTDWLLVLFNCILAIFTTRLYLETRGLREVTNRALTELERPFLALIFKEVGFKVDEQAIVSPTGRLLFAFENIGRTPAYLIEIYSALTICQPRTPAPVVSPGTIPANKGKHSNFPPGIPVKSGGDSELWENTTFAPFDADWDGFSKRNGVRSNLFFHGFVRYRDIFGSVYIMGFCAVFDILGQRFVLQGDSPHNYIRKE